MNQLVKTVTGEENRGKALANVAQDEEVSETAQLSLAAIASFASVQVQSRSRIEIVGCVTQWIE